MIIVLLLVLLKVKKIDFTFKNEELQGITNRDALKGSEEALMGNVEALNGDE